jgi:hypothetical protein
MLVLVAVVAVATVVNVPNTVIDLGEARAQSIVVEQSRSGGAALTFDMLARRTSELRGLAPRGEVERTILTPDQFRARLIDELNDEKTLESIENSRRLMVLLGLLPPELDLYALEVEFRTGVVLGQYDPETKQLYVITGSDTLGPLEQVTLAHEYTHALQDQNYDIRSLMPKNSENSDHDLAVSALLEGDALITEELFQEHVLTRAEREEKRRQERAMGSSLSLDRLPLVIREETYFPYVEGPRFIIQVLGADVLRQALQTGRGYGEAIARIYANPPLSSAQIIHPEKYLAGVRPIDVQFPDLAAALGDGWKQLRKDLLGEIDHRILIQQYLSRDLADRAASGWAGDAFAVLGNGNRTAVVVSSRWDNPAEADEWFEVYARSVEARWGNRLSVLDRRPTRIAWQTPEGVTVLSKSGTTTDILMAPTMNDVTNLERALSAPLPVASVPAPLGRQLP